MPYRRDVDPLTLRLPFEGRWLAQNSPARRVPSHGTEVFGMAHAIDFVHVGERGRSAPIGLGAFLGTEPPERFAGFGAPILAPCDGTVVAVHDGEPDHVARRSPLTLLPYMLTQATRVREGVAAVAGNYVTLEHHGRYVTLVHLQRGSLLVAPGDEVSDGRSWRAAATAATPPSRTCIFRPTTTRTCDERGPCRSASAAIANGRAAARPATSSLACRRAGRS